MTPLVFVSGESDEAKLRLAELLKSFGWRDSQIADLGGIRSARGGAYILLCISLYGRVGSADFNVSLALPSSASLRRR